MRGLALPTIAQQQQQANPVTSTVMPTAAADIVRDPTDLPTPITRHAPATVRIDVRTVELDGKPDDGTT